MNRTIPPPTRDPVEFRLQLKPYQHFSLRNGVPVYAVNAGEQEVIQIEFVFYAGNYFDEQKGVAAAANFLLKNGTGKRTALQISEDFEYYGAYCNRSCFNETAVVSLHTISKHLDKLLPVLQDMFSDSRFTEEELDVYRQNAKQRLSVNLRKCEFVAGRLIDSYLYGSDHPYGRFSTPEDYDQLNCEAIRSFYQKYYLNGSCAVFVAGKLPSNLKEMLDDFFGNLSWKKPSFQLPPVDIKPAQEKKYRIQNDPAAVQGAIRIASPFPNRHHPDFKKAAVLNTVFGGFFGSRLMNNIREDKGYTYGIYSYLHNHIQHSAWLISTEAGKDVCEATVDEVYREMEILREKEIPADELALVRNYLVGTILGDMDGPFHIMSRWKNIILNRLDENYFNETVEEIKTISARELRELANVYLRPERFYELVVY